ncbi:MAG: MoaD/ThiS family protein [Planctomycetota bacterium]|nr:MoaD/ThiS family protein [Planctomycetota bacterium]
MASIRFTPHLRRYFDLPDTWEVEGPTTVAEVIRKLDAGWPGLAFYITDERGYLRQHVAVWVDGRQVRDRMTLDEPVGPDAKVDILQALSGG